MPHEKLDREQFTLQAIAAHAGGDQVAKRVRAAMRKRVNVIESGVGEFERFSAVNAAPAAVAHRGALNRVLVVGGWKAPRPARVGGSGALTENSVIVPSGQFHLA